METREKRGENRGRIVVRQLKQVEDYRRGWGNKRHELVDVLFIALCAIMCEMTDFEDMMVFAQERKEWLRKYVELKNGVPSVSTYARVFRAMRPAALERYYRSWVKGMKGIEQGQTCIDGKSICGAGAVQKVHMVSAWAHEQGLSLGQIRVDEKSNEITAIPELLALLDIEGSVITIDAMGCQKEIAKAIIKGKGDYVLAVKDNQPTLAKEVAECFHWTDEERPEGIQIDQWKSGYEKDHGRIESRQVRVMVCPERTGVKSEWTGLASLVEYRCSRQVIGKDKTWSTRYYISSLTCSAEEMGRYLRNHWSIENRLHWMLDVAFHEDESKVRVQNAPENLNVLRKVAMALMRSTPTAKKRSAKGKMFRAALSTSFLEQALFAPPGP